MQPGLDSAPGAGAPRRAIDHVSMRVPVAGPSGRAGEVRRQLEGGEFESAHAVAVVDAGVLVGVVRLERLLAAPADTPLADLVDGPPAVIAPGADQERAARTMVESGGGSLAVVDESGRFRGLIPPERILAVVAAEHDVDLARLGGYLAGAARARGAAQESVGRRLWHRLPWLLLGLLGAMGSALIVAGFEQELDANVLIAFFIPAVIYMADAVGTQTETVLIRALAVGVPARAMVARELLSGLVMGTLIGGVFLVFALVGWGEPRIAVAVGLALVASCSLATMVAMTLPAAFQRLGRDPAFGSGPLATVVQDLLSIAVYFAIVLAVGV